MADVRAGDAVVGRDPELAVVDAFLAAARQGCAALVIHGDPGIGKTAVWQEATRRAAAARWRVLSASPSRAEADLSWAGLSDLLEQSAAELRPRLPGPQREALAAALLQESSETTDARAVCAAVLTSLRVLASREPVLVAVDDAQWLDAPTARALTFAARRLRAEPVAFSVTIRGRTDAAETFAHAVETPRRFTVSVGPMAPDDLYECIQARAARPLPAWVLGEIADVSGGNPMYALQLAARFAADQPEHGIGVPAGLADLVAAGVRRLPARTREALLHIAALRRPTVEQVDATALPPAEDAGIVEIERGRIRFSHPLFASAVYDRAGAAARRRAHRRLASLVIEEEERCRHLALSASGPDEAIAAQLDRAAGHAASRGAPAGAARLALLALRLTPEEDDDVASRRRVAAARHLIDAGDLARAEEMLGGQTSPEALQLLSRVHGRRHSFDRGLATAGEARAAPGGDALTLSRIEMDMAFYTVNMGDLLGAERHARAALNHVRSAGSASGWGPPLAVVSMVGFLSGRGWTEADTEQALLDDSPATTMVLRPEYIHSLLLLWNGRVAEAAARLDRLREDCLERGQESSAAFTVLCSVWASVWSGDLRRAVREAGRYGRTAKILHDPMATALALSASALAHAHEGALDRARADARRAIALLGDLGWRAGVAWPVWALGVAELSAGDPAAAHAALSSAAEMVVGMPSADPVMGMFLPDEVEALAALGQRRQAETIVRYMEGRATASERPWPIAAARRARAMLLGAEGDWARAADLASRAASDFEACAMPIDRMRALLLLGALLRRAKRREEARTALTAARDGFVRCGARAWADRAAGELQRLGVRPSHADQLSATERCVAEFAAAGLSNREIGERAFLTVKGVEANLTRIYRKLGIGSRVGIAAALRERDATG